MEHYLQSVSLILITAVLGILLRGSNQCFGVLLSLMAVSVVLAGAVRYLQPVVELMGQLRDLSGISSQMLSMLLKSVGICLISQVAELICKDAGENALGKVIALMTNAAILWVSIPLMEELLELIQEVLGSV